MKMEKPPTDRSWLTTELLHRINNRTTTYHIASNTTTNEYWPPLNGLEHVDMDETNSELEEMGTIEAADEAYERTKETISEVDFEPYVDYFGVDETDELWI